METNNSYTKFLNTYIDAITYGELLNKVDNWLSVRKERAFHIATLNAYCVTLAKENKRLRDIYSKADVAGADGEPFVKWMRKIKSQNTDKICARDVIIELIKHSLEKGYTFYLYGGHPDVLKNMVKNLKKEYPYMKIVGHYSPPFRKLTEAENLEIIGEINSLAPDIVLVGLGTPKQDYWIDENINLIKGSILVTCGATFDFFGGRIKMAPRVIQKSGFEWLYRLISKDFKRLFYRYTIMNAIFVLNFILQILKIKTFEAYRQTR